MSRQPARRQTRSWTSSEIQIMRNNANLGADAVATMLGRTRKSVVRKAQQERISLRPIGFRGGRLLGQPAGTRWMDQAGMPASRLREIREQAYAGEIDLGKLEARIVAEVRAKRRPICPWCSTRHVDRQTTGLCEPCHLQMLARAHREEAERASARRDLDAARQQASRARRRSDDGGAEVIELYPDGE